MFTFVLLTKTFLPTNAFFVNMCLALKFQSQSPPHFKPVDLQGPLGGTGPPGVRGADVSLNKVMLQ